MYELRCIRQSILEFANTLGQYLIMVNNQYQRQDADVKQNIQLRLSLEQTLLSEKLCVMLKIDKNSYKSKIDQLTEKIQLSQETKLRLHDTLKDVIDILYASNLFQYLQSELKKFEIIKYQAQSSVNEFE